MHLQAVGDAGRACDTCGTLFKPKRAWARFCRSDCRNAFHAAEARKEAIRGAAEDLYDALLVARQIIRGMDVEHVWLNAPETPEVTLGSKIEQALAKAGWKPTKP